MLGTPPAFILSQDQTLEIFYIQSLRTTYLFFRASVLLFYFFVRVLFSLWNREFLALQFTISCLLLYFVLSLALIYLYMMCCSIFKDQRPEHFAPLYLMLSGSDRSASRCPGLGFEHPEVLPSVPSFSRTACTLYHLSSLLSRGFLNFFEFF